MRKQQNFTCKQCGYKWEPQYGYATSLPRTCANQECRSSEWNKRPKLICWGRHRSDTGNVWIKIRDGKDAIGDKVRKQRGWEIAYCKKGERP